MKDFNDYKDLVWQWFDFLNDEFGIFKPFAWPLWIGLGIAFAFIFEFPMPVLTGIAAGVGLAFAIALVYILFVGALCLLWWLGEQR